MPRSNTLSESTGITSHGTAKDNVTDHSRLRPRHEGRNESSWSSFRHGACVAHGADLGVVETQRNAGSDHVDKALQRDHQERPLNRQTERNSSAWTIRDRARFTSMVKQTVNKSSVEIPQGLRVKDLERWKFITALQDSYTTDHPSDFHSISAIRLQLRAEFMHLYYPKEGQIFNAVKLSLLDTPDTATFMSATNALYLTQLATSTGDQRLLHNAIRSYQEALRGVRKELSRPKAHMNDIVYATIHVMSLCEAFAAISLDDDSRRQHIKGVELLLQSRGLQNIKNRYIHLQLQQHQELALRDGLLTRRRPLVGQGEWLEVRKKCPIKLTELTTLALRVPGALEDADALCAKGSSVELHEIMDRLSELKQLESNLHAWMTKWYVDFDILPYWRVPATTLAWLRDFIGIESAAFPSAFNFPSPVFAKGHVLLWTPLLVLREAIKDVAELHPFPLLATTGPEQARKLHNDIAECADDLCMTAMYLCAPDNGVDLWVEACLPLQLASAWYRRVGEDEKLGWCLQMARSIGDRGVRAPKVA